MGFFQNPVIMASLLSLSTELKLSIIEQLDLASTSFIPVPSQDLRSLSRVCTVLRTVTLPYLFKRITLLNETKSGSSVLTILNSAYAEHVRNVHYIGIMAMPESPNCRDGPVEGPSQDHFPEPVERVLSSLTRLPNLERVTVQFACAKTAAEDEEIYRYNYDIYGELETDEQVWKQKRQSHFDP
jgi:hypothetical protein